MILPRIALALFVALGIAATSRAEEKAAKNLLTDPSLETAPRPMDYPLVGMAMPSIRRKAIKPRIADAGHTGKHSLLIEGKGQWGVVRANRVAIEPGKRYRASGWVKVEGDAKAAADVKFHYYRKDGSYIDQSRIAFINRERRAGKKSR